MDTFITVLVLVAAVGEELSAVIGVVGLSVIATRVGISATPATTDSFNRATTLRGKECEISSHT